MSDYKKLKNQPLELVLVEVRYSPILNVKKYIPELHDNLRGEFPNFDAIVDKAVNINNDQVDFSNIERWLFTSRDGQRVIDIDQNRVVYATTEYDRFDGFQADVRQIVEVLKNIVNPSIYTRVGLRYCDNIVSPDGSEDGLSKLVVSELLFDNTFSDIGNKGFKRQEYLISTGTTYLVIRTVQRVTPNVLPEDLASIGLKVKVDETAKLRLLLDFDHFWQDSNNPRDFEVDNILETLSGLHEASRKAFWSATTQYARDEIWL
ncbi:TIGR04255 family protein [Salinivibrio proteolyticus]|uniref:TIGR04255 family protein n=1 Tax=Salinivibrio proteolyticus TaxID=334715 RepID=A0ABY7LDU3_9GAMM|nr:TIGR04255 family protein [Salinivibrio proteolyticus]WBA14802.1 TIGR04255 family protein [Salinivibrio proteolyticus]